MVANRRRADGFTLLEVLVVMAIMGILMAVGVPGIKTLLNNQKMKSATFDLVTTAMLARSEAIKWSGANTASIRIAAPANDFNKGWCILFSGDPAITCPDMTAVPTPAVPDGVMQIIKPTSGVVYAYGTATAPVVFTRTGRLAAPVKLLVSDDDDSADPRCVTFDTNGNASVRIMSSGAPACA